jgi:hypothetical protein
MDTVNLTFRYTEQEAIRAAMEYHRSQSWIYRNLPWSGLVAGVVTALAIWVIDYRMRADAQVWWHLLFYTLLVAGLCWVLLPSIIKRITKRTFRKLPTANLDIHWSITEDLLNQQSKGASMSLEWSRLLKAVEAKSGFLLFTHPQMAIWLPKNALAVPTDLDLLRSFIGKNQIKFHR